MQALLGIDIGTSGCKALLIGIDGAVIAADTASYPLSQPQLGWAEQDPELWVEGARRAVAGALAKAPTLELLCVGLSGQMHGLVSLDAGIRCCARRSSGTTNAIVLNASRLPRQRGG